MAYLQRVGLALDGPATHVAGITSLALVGTGASARLVSASGQQGGLLLRDAATRALVEQQAYTPAMLAGLGAGQGSAPTLATLTLGGQETLVLHGQGPGLRLWRADGGPLLDGATTLALGGQVVMTLAAAPLAAGGDVIWTTTRGSDAITAWRLAPNGSVTALQDFRPAGGGDAAGSGAEIPALEVLVQNGRTWLLAASSSADSLSLYAVDEAGQATLSDRLAPEDGLAVDTPNRLATVMVDGRMHILLGSAGTGSVTVLTVSAAGRLLVADQVNDDLASRFGGLTVLETVTLGDRAYVVAGGADDGLTLMQLLPGGRLVHLATLADALNTTLSDPAALVLRATGGAIEIHVAGEGEAGVTTLRHDPGPLAPMQQAGAGGATLVGDARADLLIGGAGDDRIEGGAGEDILVDGSGADRLTGGAGADLFVFSGADGAVDRILDFTPDEDRIDLSALGRVYSRGQLGFFKIAGGIEIRFGDERLQVFGTGLTEADFTDANLFGLWHVGPVPLPDPGREIGGDAADDMLLGKAGDDVLIGMGGTDSLAGGAGDDLLIGEYRDLPFDALAGQVERLYQAVLDRSGDAAGILAWAGRLLPAVTARAALADGDASVLSAGASRAEVTAIAAGFTASREFQTRYGGLDNAGFVSLLYRNVLGREPDAGGLAAWTGQLDRGASRASVVTGFSESAEFRTSARIDALNQSRAALQADMADDVFRIYRAVLGRSPDAAGFDAWTATMAQGRDFGTVAQGFTGSREFQTRYGGLDDDGFVTLLYRNVLGRDPDAAGLAAWSARLAGGEARSTVVTGFAQSREFVAATADPLKDWIRARGVDDRIDGGTGNNVLFGGTGADTFVFARANGGSHHVADPEAWDRVELSGFGYANAAEALSHMTRHGDDLVFADQGVSITFHDLSALSRDMILLA